MKKNVQWYLSIKTNEEKVEERNAYLECDAKLYILEFHTPHNKDVSVLLVLSINESQQSEDNENEEDIVCFVDNCD